MEDAELSGSNSLSSHLISVLFTVNSALSQRGQLQISSFIEGVH